MDAARLAVLAEELAEHDSCPVCGSAISVEIVSGTDRAVFAFCGNADCARCLVFRQEPFVDRFEMPGAAEWEAISRGPHGATIRALQAEIRGVRRGPLPVRVAVEPQPDRVLWAAVTLGVVAAVCGWIFLGVLLAWG